MKKTIMAFLTGLFLVGCGNSNASIWKITNGENVIYIGGSVHLLREKDFPLPKQFDDVYSKAQVLVFETNIDELKNQSAVMKLMEIAKLEDGKTLKDVLSEETYTLLEAKCKEHLIPMQLIESLKPSMAMQMFSSVMLIKSGITAEGADIIFADKANDDGKRIEWLEDVEFQMNMLANMADGIEDEYVKSSLEDLEKSIESLENIIDDWKHGKAAAVSELQEMKDKYPSVYKAMIYDRNMAWMPQIEKYLQSSEVEFIIVGGGHLWGSDGIITMLADKGYTVEQL
jgi:Uncharacterized protein conserved in bacteria